MSVVTEISFLWDNTILRATSNARVGRRVSGFVQVGLGPVAPYPNRNLPHRPNFPKVSPRASITYDH
jgi:hypothetical protein